MSAVKPIEVNFNKIGDSLISIQNQFDVYQNACFIQRSQEFFSLELCGEAGELANLEKKRLKGKEIQRERLAEEAADVFIALCNYANSAGINLGEAVALKLDEIEKRRLNGTF